jgi:hypothetical protein
VTAAGSGSPFRSGTRAARSGATTPSSPRTLYERPGFGGSWEDPATWEPLDGGEIVMLVPGFQNSDGLAIDDRYVYWGDHDGIERLDKP